MKKILSIILSLCMLVSLCTGLTTVPAFGQDPEFEEATDSETGSGGNPDEPGSGDNVSAGDFEEIHWPNASYEKQTDADALFDDDKDTYISVPAGKWLTFEFAEDFATAFSGMRFFESTAGTNGLATATVQVSDDGAYYYDVTAEVSQEDSFADVLFTDGETPYSVNAKFVRIKSSAAWDISGLSLIGEEAETAELPEDITAAVKETLGDTYSYDYLSPYDSYIGSVGSNGGWNARYNKYTALKKMVEQPDGTGADYWTVDTAMADQTEARTITLMFNGPIKVGGVELYPRKGDWQWVPKQVGLIGLYEDENGEIKEKTEIVTKTLAANTLSTAYETLPLYFSNEEGEELVGLKVVIAKTCANAVTYDAAQLMMLTGVGILAPKTEDDRVGNYYVAKPFNDSEIYRVAPREVTFGTTSTQTDPGASMSLRLFDHLKVNQENAGASYDEASVVEMANALNGGSTWFEFDLGAEVALSGVNVYARISDNGDKPYNDGAQGIQNITKGNLYVSKDGETWYLAGTFAGNKANICQEMKISLGETAYNITARYIKVECTEVFNNAGFTNWSLTEIGLLKPNSENDTITADDLGTLPGITNEGTITIDKTEDPISVEEIELKNDTEIASVEILNGEEVIATLDSDDYTVSDNTLTFSDEFAGSLRAGAYTVKITFADAFDTVAEIDLTVIFERPLILTDLTEEDFEEISWINASYEKQTEADALFDDADATVISVPKGTDITFGLSADYEKAFYGIRFFKKSDGANYLNTAKAWVSEDGAYFYEVTPQIVDEATYTDVTLTDGTTPYKVGVRYVKIRVNDASATTWDISEISFLEALENDNEFATLPDDIAGAVLASESGKYGYEHLDQSSSYIGSVGSNGGWNARYNKYTALKKMVEQPDGTGADYWTVDTAMADQTEARTITLMFNGPIKVGGVELYPRKGDWQWVPKQVGLIGLYEDENGEIKEKTEIVTKTLASNSLSSTYQTLPLYFSNEDGEELVGVKVVIAKTCANAVTYDAAQLMMLTGVGILAPKAEDDRVGNYYVAKPFNDSEIYRVAPREVTFGTTSTQTDPGASMSLRLFDHLKVNQENAGASYDEASVVEMANALNGGSTWFEFDLGAEVTLSGVNVYARISDNGDKPYNDGAQGIQNITKGNLYVSKDGETWYLAGTFAGNKANICQEMKISLGETAYNITARYIKVECTEVFNNAGFTNWSLTEIGLLKPNSENDTITADDLENMPGITNEGVITIDQTGETVEAGEITLKNDTEIVSVEILKGEEVVATLGAADYTVSGTTLTFSADFASSLRLGDYTLKITFGDELGTYADIALEVKDEKVATLLLVSREMVSDSPVQQSTIVLTNLYPEVEAPVVKIGETEITSSVTEEGIVINSADLVSAYDIYEGMDLISNELILTVTYGENSVEYPLIVTTDWFSSADKTVPTWESGKIYTAAVFADDEVDAASYENFRVRSDSTVSHKRWNAINAFLVDVPEGVQGTYTYHSKTGYPRNYIDVDFGEPVEVGGLRYLSRKPSANYQGLLKKIVIMGSNTLNGEDWVILYDGSAVGTEKSYDLIFEEKATYQYYRLYMEGSENYVSVAGFHFLKAETRITGTSQYDTATEQDVVINFRTYEPGLEVTEIKLDGEVLDESSYVVSNGTITINKECFQGVIEGESYPVVITFNDGSTIDTVVEVVDCSQAEFLFSTISGSSVSRTDSIVLKNAKGLSVTKVVLKSDGTNIPYTANEETITIQRSDFRKAFDVYKELGLETGKVKLLVKFEDDSFVTYTVNLSGGWAKKANAISSNAAFGDDEIDIIADYPNFAVRTDSVWLNSLNNHPVNAFFGATIAELTGGYRYHGDTTEGNNHYLDVDFGDTVAVGGLRYNARYENERYQPNWSKVEIYGSNDFETWEKLYDGSATGSARVTDMKFSKNAEVRYLRIYISNTQYATAASIRLLAPSLRIYNEFGGIMTAITLDKSDANEEVIVYTDLPVTGVKVGGATVSSSNYTFDEETMALTIKKGALSAIKTAGVATTIEVFADGMSATLNVNFGEKLFKEEVLPYNFANTIKYVSGYSNGGGASNLIDRGVVRRKADGKVMGNGEEDKKLKASGFIVESAAAEIYNDKETGANPVIEIDYQIPHTFSGVRVYHRIWEGNGDRQFGQSMMKAYLQVSNDGVNWLTSDTWNATLENGSNKNSYDDIKFMIKGEEVNVQARYLRLCIVPSGSVTSLMEICLYQPGSGRSLIPAEISFDGERTLFSAAEPKDMTLGVVYNEAVALSEITVAEDGEEIMTVDPSYINTQGDTIVITKDFFLDNFCSVDSEGNISLIEEKEFDFVMSFVMGEDIYVPSGCVDEEIHSITVTIEDGHESKVTVTAPAEAKRHEDTVLVATVEDGFEVVWSIEENIKTTYTEKPLLLDEKWKISSTGFDNGRMVFDGDSTSRALALSANITGSADFSGNPPTITVDFGKEETTTLTGIVWENWVNTAFGDYIGNSAKTFKLYAINDDVAADTPFYSGNVAFVIGSQALDFDEIELEGVKIEITSGYNINCDIAEISFVEKVASVKNVAVKGEVIRKGTKTEEFKITDLYADATVKVSTVPVAAGNVKVTTDLVGLSTTADTPTTATKGETLEVTLVAHEGEELPAEIAEITQDGHVLISGQDYSYVITTPEEEVSLAEVSLQSEGDQIGVITIWNARGDIHIVADAAGVIRRKVAFTDEYGAKGELPQTKFYMAGEEITIPASKLTLSGYTFKGWNLVGEVVEEGEEYTLYNKDDTFVIPEDDVIFVAVWEAKPQGEKPQRPQGGGDAGADEDDHESFGGGGFGGVSDKFQVVVSGIGTQTVTKGTVLTAPAVEAGYEFVGWYLDAAYTVPYANSGVTGNLTVYPYIRKIRQVTDLADIQNHWAKEAISKMYVDYIVNGKSETAFDPDSDITRAEFCQILYKISGQTSDGSENFADVNVGDWYINAVAWAVNQGITMGTTEDTFSPYAKITREQMATMIYRYATKVGAEWEISGEASFADKTQISTYANYQVNWAADKGVISGYPDGTFGPAKEATRAEAVVMLTRLINLLSK